MVFDVMKTRRDRAMVMLRCGLRVEEVAGLRLSAIDLRQQQIIVHNGTPPARYLVAYVYPFTQQLSF
jgi:site-specific recombinase XerC